MLDIHYNIIQGIQNAVSSLGISVSIKIKLLLIHQDQLSSGLLIVVFQFIVIFYMSHSPLSNQVESEHPF